MFTLYFFIYQVASALEKRSQANAKKVSNLIGVSSSTMTNLVINMSKNHQTPQAEIVSPSPSTKKKKQQSNTSSPVKRDGSVDDDDPGSSIVNATTTNTNQNGLDVTNRSSSNETSGEHTPIGVVAPNITNLLALSKAGMDSNKQLDENQTLLPTTQDKNATIITTKTTTQKTSARSGSSSKAMKALRTITVIMGAFVLCWTPVSIYF
jgi:hypothetical protein